MLLLNTKFLDLKTMIKMYLLCFDLCLFSPSLNSPPFSPAIAHNHLNFLRYFKVFGKTRFPQFTRSTKMPQAQMSQGSQVLTSRCFWYPLK